MSASAATTAAAHTVLNVGGDADPAAAAAPTPSSEPSRGGAGHSSHAHWRSAVLAARRARRPATLMGWGLAKAGLPVPKSFVDPAGDCCYPAPILVRAPKSDARARRRSSAAAASRCTARAGAGAAGKAGARAHQGGGAEGKRDAEAASGAGAGAGAGAGTSAGAGAAACPRWRPVTTQRRRTPRFVRAAADMGVFAALDETGTLWLWGKDRSGFPDAPTPHPLPDGSHAVDCSVGATFVVAVCEAGRVWAIGKLPFAHSGPSTMEASFVELSVGGGGEAAAARPFAVEAEVCHETVMVTCHDGSVWSAGTALTSGHGKRHASLALRRVAGLAEVKVLTVAVGSLHAAAIDDTGRLWVWGDGLSGELGLGKRHRHVAAPTLVPADAHGSLRVVSVACTRAQATPKRQSGKPFRTGQEGPRMHVVTEDGGLWVAGTTHKGLGGDHLHKTFTPGHDLLGLYRVGGAAADRKHKGGAIPTGGAEDLALGHAADAAWALGLATPDASSLGAGGDTHYLEAARIVASQPAHIHSLALAADGRLFAWGCGSNGRTGLRAFMRGPGGSKRRLKCYVSSPTAVEALRGQRVLFATAGKYWSLAVVEQAPAASGDRHPPGAAP